jgi:hypothetical protein
VKPLREAAADVALILKTTPQRTASFAMVAIDSGIEPDEPLVLEVMKVLERRWQSYAGAFTDRKLPTVARAIILHALSSAMSSDSIAAAVSLTARTMLPCLGEPKDFAIWNGLITDADRRLALRAEREWALPSASVGSDSELKLPALVAIEAPQVPRNWLAERLGAAAGPHNAENEAYKAPVNPQFPNTGQPWSNAFAPIAASAVSSAVDSALKTLVQKLNEQQAPEALQTAITSYIRGAAGAVSRNAEGLERRTTLLWWKEALYSPSAQVSYRELGPTVAAALAAADASAQTGPFAPRMAEAFLRETLFAIDGSEFVRERALVDCAHEIASAPANVRDVLGSIFASVHQEQGRAPLAALMANAAALTPETITQRLGLPGDTAVSPMSLGVWLFRDLQAGAATPAPVKRTRGSKSK